MGEYQVFPWKKLCLTVAKDFIGGGGCFKIFRRKFFVSLPKVSIGDSFSVSLISAIELVWKKGGEYQGFPSKTFVSQCRKFS